MTNLLRLCGVVLALSCVFSWTPVQAKEEYYAATRNAIGTEWFVNLVVENNSITAKLEYRSCLDCMQSVQRFSCETKPYTAGQSFDLWCRSPRNRQHLMGNLQQALLDHNSKAGSAKIGFIPLSQKAEFESFLQATRKLDTKFFRDGDTSQDAQTQQAQAQPPSKPVSGLQALVQSVANVTQTLTPKPTIEFKITTPETNEVEEAQGVPGLAPEKLEDVQKTPKQTPPTEMEESLAQLRTLKSMLDGGLISQQDYEDRKSVILDRIAGRGSAQDDPPVQVQAANVTPEIQKPKPVKPEIPNLDFGGYYALVIGINDYVELPVLSTAINDAEDVARTLKDDYGFKVTKLINPTRNMIIDALDDYRMNLGRNDNLLIYYAGHGWLDEAADQGYWLPVNARAQRRSSWVSNATISDSIRAIAAKHIMIVADSCYSGSLTRSVNLNFRSLDYVERMIQKKARLVMTSGGLEPVSDGAGRNSPFAKAFITALQNNQGLIDGTKLFTQIRRPVMVKANQTPEYADVKNTGHDGGDFILVRKATP